MNIDTVIKIIRSERRAEAGQLIKAFKPRKSRVDASSTWLNCHANLRRLERNGSPPPEEKNLRQ